VTTINLPVEKLVEGFHWFSINRHCNQDGYLSERHVLS